MLQSQLCMRAMSIGENIHLTFLWMGPLYRDTTWISWHLKVTGESSVVSTACSDQQWGKHQSSALLAFYEKKRPVNRKAFPCHDFIMITTLYFSVIYLINGSWREFWPSFPGLVQPVWGNKGSMHPYTHPCYYRADSRFALSQCNAISHWLGASLDSSLSYYCWHCLSHSIRKTIIWCQ